MAIANFFDRTLLSAAQALQGFNPQEIRTRLAGLAVELAFDASATTRAEGRAALDMAARLLARLYPTLRLTPLGLGGRGARHCSGRAGQGDQPEH
ncbi:E2 ligase fold family C protein [Phenylobacterium sp. J426]|uniref:E2 ligase fold family C protein n=1 Tax=Phenylobacterium sp. J426 TaxID=2898439 RepID=UPI002150B08E|nr:E2 ligase fold family C protein [Phenylobacterium sp. J426]